VLKTHKIPLMRWGALDWVGETTSAKRSYLKKITRKPFDYFLAPMGVIPCLTDSGNMETKKALAIRFIKICIRELKQKTFWFQLDLFLI